MNETSLDRSFVTDGVMAVVLFFAALLSLSGFSGSEDARSFGAGAIVLIGAQTLSLAWRRRYPTAILIVVTVAFLAERALDYPQSWAYFGVAFAIYTVGAEVRFRRSRIVAVSAILVSSAWTVVGTFVYEIPLTAVLGTFVYLTFPWLIGVESRRREQRALDLEARAIRAELTREHDAAQAVRDERARIARELHDVVAHEMTVMTVQAAAAERAVDSDPQMAKRSMEIVGEAGRRGLDEMRRLLGLLRDGDRLELDPQPGLASLASLAFQVTEAGVPVHLTVEGSQRDLPPGIDLNAYRIVQESLTNTARHGGPGAKADVRVTYRAEALVIDVVDDGIGAATTLTSTNAGHGLIGMRERVSLLDGSLSAGPKSGGGYRVSATIPIPQR